MLTKFIADNRDAIIQQVQARQVAREGVSVAERRDGTLRFIQQLEDTFRTAASHAASEHVLAERPTRQRQALLRIGLRFGHVVSDYTDVYQAVTDLARKHDVPVVPGDLRALEICLDNAIVGAAAEFSTEREQAITDAGTESLGALAHELRNKLNVAMLAFELVQKGSVSPGGSTSALMGRSLLDLRDLIDRSLSVVRLDAAVARVERIPIGELLAEVEVGASLQADARDIRLAVVGVDRTAAVEGDRHILAAAVSNLLQNAFKFTPRSGHVVLSTALTSDRVMIEVSDECGGLPPGKAEELFQPYSQRGENRSGLGLGLSICERAARASGGEIRVRDLPGKGCVFTLDLPRVDSD